MLRLDLRTHARLAKELLMPAMVLVGLAACSDPTTVVGPSSSTARDDMSAVTVATSAPEVSDGDVLWLRLSLSNPCPEGRAALSLAVSWNSERFEYMATPADLADRGVYLAEEGIAYLRVGDIRSVGREIALPFRALASGLADGFAVEEVSFGCAETGGATEPFVLHVW